MHSAACDPTHWLASTADNSATRRVVIVNAWPYIGLGHQIPGAAKWMALIQEWFQAGRALRFAYCVPRGLARRFARPPSHRMPACEKSPFDLFEHVSFHGLSNLRALPVDVANASFPRVGTCEQLRSTIYGSAVTVALHGFPSRLLDRCLFEAHVAWPTCLRRLQPSFSIVHEQATPSSSLGNAHAVTARSPLPGCAVGLHLRTLAVDSGQRCNLLSDGNTSLSQRRRGVWHNCAAERAARKRRCRTVGFPALIRGCSRHVGDAVLPPAERPMDSMLFASSDSVLMYTSTRQAGWHDLNETAVHASFGWTRDRLFDLQRSIAAWLVLATCTRAIIAPIPSAYSDSAALAAGVPIIGCCQELRGVRRLRRLPSSASSPR